MNYFATYTTYLPIRISNVRTVPSTLPPIISVFVKQTDITLSENESIICKNNPQKKSKFKISPITNKPIQTNKPTKHKKLNLNRLSAMRPTVPSTQWLIITRRNHHRRILIKLHSIHLQIKSKLVQIQSNYTKNFPKFKFVV